MKNLKNRINQLYKHLKGMDGINVVLVNEYKGETREDAIKRYKKKNEYIITNNPDIFIHVKSNEQILQGFKNGKINTY